MLLLTPLLFTKAPGYPGFRGDRGFCLSAGQDLFQRYVRASGLRPGDQCGAGDSDCG